MEDPTPAQTIKTDDPSPPSSIGLQWLRETVTAAIAIAILVITCVMLMETFNSAKYLPNVSVTDPAIRKAQTDEREQAFEHQKDILLYGLALLGTVTGYFFGRVPAELHAVQAQKAADVAQVHADDAKNAESKAKEDKARVVNRTMMVVNQALAPETPAHGVSREIPTDAQAAAHLAKTRQNLQDLRDWLSGGQE